MPNARIFQRLKSTMQSGRARTDRWILEFEPAEAKKPDPLTGWAGSGDVSDQVRLSFPTSQAAIDYCEKQGWTYTLIPAPQRSLKLQSYADNFR
jgi:hypothetical protein